MSKKRDFRLQSEITRRIEAEAERDNLRKTMEKALAAPPPAAPAAPPPAPPKTLRAMLGETPPHLHAQFVLAHEADILATGWDKPPAQRSE